MKIARWRGGGARAPPVLPLASPVAERQGPLLQLFTTSQCLRNLFEKRKHANCAEIARKRHPRSGRWEGARASPSPNCDFFCFRSVLWPASTTVSPLFLLSFVLLAGPQGGEGREGEVRGKEDREGGGQARARSARGGGH